VVKDFEPVAMIASTPFLFVVRPDFPAKDMKELIAFAKANPGKLNVAATGRGTGTHLAIEMLQQKAGITVQTIFYKGSLESVTDVLAGRIDAMFSPISTAKPHLAAGKLRALAITSPQRSALVPDVPTVAEAGVPGYAAAMWTGLFAPAGTPQTIIDRLSAAATKAAGSPALQGKIRNGGGDAIVMGKKDFSNFVQEDIARWQTVVKAAGIEPN
jgi:tripartite-type tricarboxylate transporter receptor subunit TctC